MKSLKCQASSCNYCRYYTHEGRRGGQCALLGVPVRSSWKACSLAVPVFLNPVPMLAPLELVPPSAVALTPVMEDTEDLEALYVAD